MKKTSLIGNKPTKGTLNFELKKILAREYNKNLPGALVRVKKAVATIGKKIQHCFI
jgi:hypothetical protein